MEAHTKMAETVITNGIDVTELENTIEAVKAEPELAKFQFRAKNRWDMGGYKSTVFILLLAWLLVSRNNYTIQLCGTNELHCRRTQFQRLIKTIQATPKLRKLISEKQITKNEIKFKSNVIQVSATSFAGSFGDRINILWASDLHDSSDLEPFNAYQAATLDSDNSQIYIDSNVDSIDGEVHRLERASKKDDSFFCDRVEYKNFEHYEKEAPEWIPSN